MAQGRRWALPMLWEFGVPAAIAVLPAKFKVNWRGMVLYGPDVSYALTAIGGLAALTGLLRIAKAGRRCAGRPAPGKSSKQLAAATGQMTSGPGSGTLASSAPSRRFATLR